MRYLLFLIGIYLTVIDVYSQSFEGPKYIQTAQRAVDSLISEKRVYIPSLVNTKSEYIEESAIYCVEHSDPEYPIYRLKCDPIPTKKMVRSMIEKDYSSVNKSILTQINVGDAVSYVIPMYSLVLKDDISSISNLIDFQFDVHSYVAIVDKQGWYYSFYSNIGILNKWGKYSQESWFDYEYNVMNTGSVDAIKVNNVYFGKYNYTELSNIISSDRFEKLFVVIYFSGLWAIDHDGILWHISCVDGKPKMEDGQIYYSHLLADNGEECLRNVIGGYPCVSWIVGNDK